MAASFPNARASRGGETPIASWLAAALRNPVWLVGVLILAAFLINLFVIPDRFIVESLFVVPVVIAAQRLRPRVVAVVSAFSVVLYAVDAFLERPPALMIPLEILALSAIAYFAVSLARQSERTRAALEERARLYSEAQEAIRARDDFRRWPATSCARRSTRSSS